MSRCRIERETRNSERGNWQRRGDNVALAPSPMERVSPAPRRECTSLRAAEALPHAAAGDAGRTNCGKQTQGDSQAASGSRTPLKQSSLETVRHAGGDGVASPEPNKEQTVTGEVCGSLPGSKSVARESTHEVEPGRPCCFPTRQLRAPSGRGVQRQEARSEESQGVRSVRSNQGQPRASGADAGEGADTTTQPAKETSAVRTTDSSWRTSLRAITNKATQDKGHRFGGLYRLLNEEN